MPANSVSTGYWQAATSALITAAVAAGAAVAAYSRRVFVDYLRDEIREGAMLAHGAAIEAIRHETSALSSDFRAHVARDEAAHISTTASLARIEAALGVANLRGVDNHDKLLALAVSADYVKEELNNLRRRMHDAANLANEQALKAGIQGRQDRQQDRQR